MESMKGAKIRCSESSAFMRVNPLTPPESGEKSSTFGWGKNLKMGKKLK